MVLARKPAVPLSPLDDFGFEERYAWGARPEAKPEPNPSVALVHVCVYI